MKLQVVAVFVVVSIVFPSVVFGKVSVYLFSQLISANIVHIMSNLKFLAIRKEKLRFARRT